MQEVTQAPRRENWFDPDYVREWVQRQEERSPETRQFTRVLSAIPRAADEPFHYLNLGAGGGTLDALILERFPNAEATLVDGSAVMVEQVRARLRPFSSRATVIESNLSEPTWLEAVRGSFEGAVSTIALHNLRDPMRIRALYAEVGGVLADGGWFLNLDYVRAAAPAVADWFRWTAGSDGATSGGQWRAGGGADCGGRGAGRGFPGTLDEQLVWLREAGFGPVDCLWKEAQLVLLGAFKGSMRIPTAS